MKLRICMQINCVNCQCVLGSTCCNQLCFYFPVSYGGCKSC